MSCRLERKNETESEGLQELRRSKGKVGRAGSRRGAEVWDHEDTLFLGPGAEPGLLTSLLSVNICEQMLVMCVYCLLLLSVSFCRK